MTLIGLLGLPGAGKTTALDALTNQSGTTFDGFQMKEVAGEEYHNAVKEGLDAFPQHLQTQLQEQDLAEDAIPTGDFGNEIAGWVDTIMGVQNDYFALKAASLIETKLSEADVVVVDGIRSVSDAEGLSTATDDYYLVYLHTPFHVRLQRLQSLAREGEENVDADYLLDRDAQELGWGVNEILSATDEGSYKYPVNYFYANHDSVESFTHDFIPYINTLIAP